MIPTLSDTEVTSLFARTFVRLGGGSDLRVRACRVPSQRHVVEWRRSGTLIEITVSEVVPDGLLPDLAEFVFGAVAGEGWAPSDALREFADGTRQEGAVE